MIKFHFNFFEVCTPHYKRIMLIRSLYT